MSQLGNLREFVQQVAEAIASVIDIEVTILDDDLIRLAGTGKYSDKIGQKMPPGSVAHQIAQHGKVIYIDTPGHSPICFECPLKTECNESAELCYPIIANNKPVGTLGLIAFNEHQKQQLEANKEFLINFLDKMSSLISSKLSDYNKTSIIVDLKNQMEGTINNIDEGIVVVNNGSIAYANAKALNYFDDLELIGKRLKDVIIDNLFIGNINKGQSYKQYIYTHHGEKVAINVLFLKDRESSSSDRQILLIVRKVKEIQNAEYNIRRKLLKKGHVAKWKFEDLVYQSQSFHDTIEEAKRYAFIDSTILITGESGTGKELVAQSIHNYSKRKSGPFVAINCAALPETLLESELFGYVPGAFTGASKDGKQGLFELAHMGTIFLDEIGDMDLYMQSRLLRVLEQREVMRIGDEKIIPVDVRIIAATNRYLEKDIASRQFRQDLYYRLNVLRLSLDPLRERSEDIPILMSNFITYYSNKYKIEPFNLDKTIVAILSEYSWPGNVRELKSMAERLVVLSGIKQISCNLISRLLSENKAFPSRNENLLNIDIDLTGSFVSIERQLIDATLAYTDQNIDKASALLGISKSTIWRRKKL